MWLPLLVAATGTGLAQSPDHAGGAWLEKPRDDYWSKHFRLGALVGLNLKADFKMNGTFAVSGYNPGTLANGTDHFYDDGYVRVDENPLDTVNYWTSYWGYNNAASQVSGGSLLFHSAYSFTANGSSSENGGAQVGIDLAYGGHLFRWGDALVGWEFGFGWLPVDIEDNNPIAITAMRTVQSYNYGSIVLPDAPYNGGPSGLGPNIRNMPGGLPDAAASGTVSGHQLDLSLYTFRLGPTFHWELPWNFATQISAGAALGFVAGDMEYNETLLFTDGSRATNQGSVGDDQFVYGGYLAATLMYHVEKHGDVYLGIQYMPMSSASFSGGGREAELDLSGAVYVSFGVNWPF